MKFAVISDIHSNFEALVAVLREIGKKKVDEIICLGDIVGYGANPDEVVELVRNEVKYSVRGNHDDALFSDETFLALNSYAKSAITYTAEIVSDKNKEWLKELPNIQKLDDIMMVHACPSAPQSWKYVFTQEDAEIELSSFQERICLIGHTHVPVIFKNSSGLGGAAKIRELINVGSVGQPRDGDNRASFGIIDTRNFTYANLRIEYNYRTAADKIMAAGLPSILGERLHRGR
ncbi:MAG TPA: metallophosphoesterase family protein [Candidatus Acidoferrales bacterium]|nr:metallophosphoesterase family protein [Candidatus Acidoferrales bacterium]